MRYSNSKYRFMRDPITNISPIWQDKKKLLGIGA